MTIMPATRVSRRGLGAAKATGMRGSKAADRTRSSFQIVTWSWPFSADLSKGDELKYLARIWDDTAGPVSVVLVRGIGFICSLLLVFTHSELDRSIWFGIVFNVEPSMKQNKICLVTEVTE